MAAGLGFKTFTTGEVLTASDVNGYLMQGVLVFASEAARNAAITSPQEGQFAYTKDNNSLWYYTGSAWAASGATGDIEGVTAGVGISGGGTSGTVTVTNSMATAIDAKGDLVPGTGADTFARLAVGANGTVLTADSTAATGLAWSTPSGGSSGLNLISNQALSAQTSIVFNSCFSSTYRNYRVIMNLTSTATDPIRMRLRSGSTNATGADYNLQYSEVDNATASGFRLTGETSFRFSPVRSSGTTFIVLDINNPFIAAATTITGEGMDPANPNYNAYAENHTLATSYDGMTIFAATYNLTGNIAVYGYGA